MKCNFCWLHCAPQGTTDWHDIRKGRLTASRFGAALGRNPWQTQQKTARELLGLEKPEFDEESKGRMMVGSIMEEHIRNHYCKTKNLRVREVGMGVPYVEERIGGSPDGLVYTDPRLDMCSNDVVTNKAVGLIEIKCSSSHTSYMKLEGLFQRLSAGYKLGLYDCSHIPNYYYDQMQGCMNIFNKGWCDYVFYYMPSDILFVERVHNNYDYWNQFMLPGFRSFLDNLSSIAADNNDH